ncbi:MAG: ABC transporter permease [Gemmatimonadota bacterium]
MRPPRRWRAFLARVLPQDDRDVLLDELDRLYTRRAQSEGARAAARWYRAEVMAFVTRAPAERLRDARKKTEVEVGDLVRLVRRTIRSLWRAPGFALVAIATLGLGIGASAVIVGIADRALLRPLPYPDADRLVAVLAGWGTNLGSVEILQREMTTLADVGAAQNATGMTWEAEGVPARRITAAAVSPEYLEALRVTPQIGRTFTAAESRPGAERVVLMGDEFWRTHFGADPGALDRALTLDGQAYRIVGVLPRGFDMPSSRNDVWRPAVLDASNPGLLWGTGNYTAVGRLAPGATAEAVRQELLRVQDEVRTANPLWTPNPGFWDEARVTPLVEARAQAVRAPLLILLIAVGVVLLVVCANVANLFLSRALARGRDYAVRAALGAGAGRLAREQLLESLVLAGMGLIVGLSIAALGLELLRPHLPSDLPGASSATLDLRIIMITALLALGAGLSAGLLPALRTARRALALELKESGRSGTASRSRRRTTRGLVMAQLAAAVVLVTSAGLLARTLLALGNVDPGFQVEDRVIALVHVPPGLTDEREARAAWFEELEAHLEADPSSRGVTLASTIPFGMEDEYIAMSIDGVTTDPNDLPVMPHHRVSPSYFDVTGIPLLRGRGFSASDRFGAPMVAVVDQTFVDRFLPGLDPIGRVVRYPWRGAPPIEIVGVVGPTFQGDLAAVAEPTVWVPLAQMGMGALGHAVVVLHASGDLDAALDAVTARTRDADPRIALSDLAHYSDLLATSLASTRLLAFLLLIFATSTLALGAVGVYGVAAFSVRERIKEIGVRMAMGAPVQGIRRSVLGDGLRLALPGGLLGLVLAVPAARALKGILYGVAPLDPVTFVVVPVLLALTALLAVYVPARRATQVDPATVLRDD